MIMIQHILNSICKGWESEYRFYSPRRWKADFANPELKIIVEIEGGAFSYGRHVRGVGFLNDIEKYNAATLLGWKVLRYTPQQTGTMMNDVRTLIDQLEKVRPV
jgi:very-short-patch-repair endonuclease